MQILWCWFGFWVVFKPIIKKFCRVSYVIYLALLLLLLFSVSLVNTYPDQKTVSLDKCKVLQSKNFAEGSSRFL